ncbi:hypothetical protein RNH31_005433, partial [Salmonella enterica]|nr:hypothetical protein [Salmonella enterica]
MSTPYVWDWNAPRPAIDPSTFAKKSEKSDLARLISLFDREAEQHQKQKEEEEKRRRKTFFEKKIDEAIDRDELRDEALAQ